MPDTEIRTLHSSEWEMQTCPVLEVAEDEEGYELIPCGEPLTVIATRNVVGDDFGSFHVFMAGFQCGHTFDEMVTSMKNAEYA